MFPEVLLWLILKEQSTRDHYDESSKDISKGTKKADDEKHLSVFDQDGMKIFFTGQRSSSDFSVSFFSAPKRFHHFSIMTAFINGKKITTKRHLENESKYLEVEEDGKTVSIHVNGIPVYDREYYGAPGNEWDYRLDKWHHCSGRWRHWTCEKRRWADEWRGWANKWRNWAEECRNWAQEKHHQEDKGSSGTSVGHHKADAECPKAEEYSKSDKGCHKPGAKYPGFPMPGEGKTSVNEGFSKTNKGQLRPEEEDTRSDKGYFVFPKPGEKNSDLDKGHHRTIKKQHRPEDKGNPGIHRPGEGHDDGHIRTKKGQPRPEEGQSKLGKMYHGSKKSDQASPGHKTSDSVCSEAAMKHKTVSDYNSQAENRKLHIGGYKQLDEENNQHAIKNENRPRKNELKDEKQGPIGENGGLTFESESDRASELNDMRKKSPVYAKVPHKPVLTICGAKGLRTRKPYAKRSKSHIGRNKLCSSRNKSQAGKNRMSDGHRKTTPDSLNGSREVAPDRKKTPVDCKYTPQSRNKGSLPPLQEDKIPLLMRKRLPRRRTHNLPSETRDEKYQFISEISQSLDINSQQQGRLIKMPRTSSCLPSIRGQKFGMDQLPNVTR
ncbi:uncharacterized protein LOC128342827 isoform X2 [Hemicordylus capensis]|uniref:uncharacterized protein LOC128342827 isoform X2 n=1 Tax=Hemicordylus capensis TaxID=884348 RepID=UPI002302448A|nr:uncharacterized protein LOC128342827 isoform X2 [Hemicordylus capensis]